MHKPGQFYFRLAVALVTFAVCTLVAITPVSAHVFLKSASPAPDQVLSQAPAQVVLTFSGDLESKGSVVTVTDPSGARVDLGDVAIDPQNKVILTVSLKAFSSGVYLVNYTAVSAADGHSTDGNYRFGVGAVTLTPYALNRACATLPTLTVVSSDASVHFISPADNSTLTTSRLDFDLDTQNFNLGSNGNYAEVWLDGQPFQRIDSSGGHGIDVTNGIHDVCLALIDATTGAEIGARAGIRVLVNAGTAPGTGMSFSVWVVLPILMAALLVGGVAWRLRNYRK